MTPVLLQLLRQPAMAPGLTLADWDLALRQAASARLEASLLAMLETAGVAAALPEQVRAHFTWAQVHAARHGRAVLWEVERIGAALAGLDMPVILLKGGAYALAGLPSGQGRMFSDIDILVPKDMLGPVEAALMMHGWRSTDEDAYNQTYYRKWMHELPPMQHGQRLSVIDVHHAILPETAAARPDPLKLRAAALAIPGHPGWQMLAPADMVIHSAVHLFYDGELDHGMRDLLDLHRLLQHFGGDPAFWAQLAPRAAELQVGRVLFYALRYCQRLLHTPVPAAVSAAADAARPAAPLLALMDSLFERVLLPHHASCSDGLGALARFLLYLRGNWLRMPPLMLARHLFHKAFLSRKKH
ncbi:MAG: nucleotidyltransferase family protein [Pseudomonadota bacterium]